MARLAWSVRVAVAALLVWSALAVAPAIGIGGGNAFAAEEEERPHKTRRVPTMSEQTFKKLAEAQEFIDAKDYDSARNVLDNMLGRRSLNGNEVGQIYNMLGFVSFSQENYTQAIKDYEKVLAQGEDIPEGLETTTLYTLAQLNFVADRYEEALRYMETWITKATNPGADPYIFMGQVYYQMKDYDNAIVQIEKGIQVAKERDLTVKENWWALLNYLYFEKENWDKVIEILEILVRDFPKRDYWIRLAGIYGQEGQEKEQVYAMQGAYTAGYLDRERDLMNFAGLLMQDQVPYRAAKVMEKGFQEKLIERTAKNLQALGQAWQLAQETDKAIPAYEEAGKLSDDGRIYERLAQVYFDDDQYDKCVQTSDRALDKGGLRSLPQAYIIKGMCQYNINQNSPANLVQARRSFAECRTESRRAKDGSNERVCGQWIVYIDRETQRLEQLERAI